MNKSNVRLELERGCGFEQQRRFKLAHDSYLIAAKAGSIEAQVNLANLYDEGKGCKRDITAAIHWYKRAVKSGSAEAAYNLGVHYQRRGVARWAGHWFKRAAELGDGDAKKELRRLIKRSK
ncbi:tetratricopeptide repeat protein [Peristeroidobacter soli]|jgi:TPR repeat protein|uniref:tetratricopeptide repeat protein n=1 Tax=Peristeroidobacter soli TaxID=2497877 RepID=UPI00101C15BE|nr:tetratricopeptide repeat protein [Peristeroidobacter soli]